MSNPRLALGHWGLPEAASGFYPDDLPEDWRLAFYANEFHALACPLQCLAELTPAQVIADTPAEFRLYPVQTPTAAWAALGQRLGGGIDPWPLVTFTPDNFQPTVTLAPQTLLQLTGLWPIPQLRHVLEFSIKNNVLGCFFSDLTSLRTAVTLADLLGIAH